MTLDPRPVEVNTWLLFAWYALLVLVFPETSKEYDVDALLLPMLVDPMKELAPLCVEELLNVVFPVDVRDVVVSARRLAVPNVCVRSPPAVRLPRVPTLVRELLVTPDPKAVDVKTWLPPK